MFISPELSAFDTPQDWNAPVLQEDMMKSLAGVAQMFGPDAVILQTALLNQAVLNGSILEAKVEAPAYQNRDGKQYIAFTLESGIVYNDKSVSADDRIRRTWRDIVAGALHRMTELQFQAQGVAVTVGYHHRPYEDERQLREQLPDGRGEPERLSYFLLIDDAAKLARGTAEPDEVLTRTVVVRGNDPVQPK